MLITTSESTEVLNDLIRINNDRMNGFKRAIENLNDDSRDIEPILDQYVQQSRSFIKELSQEVLKGDLQHTANNEKNVKESLHKAWSNVKSTFSSKNIKSILMECEKQENLTINTYRDILKLSSLTKPETALINTQLNKLIESKDKIISLIDNRVLSKELV